VSEPAVRERSFPELSSLKTLVAFLLKESRKGLRVPQEREHLLARDSGGRIVVTNLVLVRVLAGQDAGETRATKGGGNITVDKGGALRGEFVEVGGLDDLMTHEPEIGPGLVIGNNQEDIGWVLRVCSENG